LFSATTGPVVAENKSFHVAYNLDEFESEKWMKDADAVPL